MSLTVADAVDCKGYPADKSKTGGWVPAVLILGIEIVERLSTMGIAVNLVTYLGGIMHLPSTTSANIVTDFMGTSFLLCLLGGFLADSFLGRYNTIAIFAIIQTLGTGLLALTTKLPSLRPPPCSPHHASCKQANGFQMGILYLALYLTALGTGGLKSSVSGFGTDQFDEKDEKEKSQMAYFFNRFFFFISIGTLTAVTVLVYIQDEVGRSVAYGICSISMLIAILIFFSGTRRFRYKKSSGSPIVQIFQVIVAAVKKRNLNMPYNLDMLYEDTPENLRIAHTDQFRSLDKAAIVAAGAFEIGNKYSSSTPNPWKLCSVTRVEEVKMMARLLPIWATTIIFWTIYAQMITFSVEQASTMERSFGSFMIPAGSLTVFFVAAVLITLAVYDRLIMPLWKKWKGKPGFSNLQRIAIGLVLSTIGMVVAALVETKRLSVAKSIGRSTQTLPMSVFFLIPQFFLVGSGEAFIYTGQLDFFITQSPKGMKTMSTGLFLTTLSLGFFISSFLVSVIKKVISDI
ncbi:NRT1 PTR FAMILY [Olea europaea subsp. europaea]|uniref:NRT1 PTR FAMILY n=1 Tax=Olea europaea subsp. europaea TaxID=158383 RepID=A0A8S0VI25_OLEEU|nr:NRT1 PTR FAMILY [Olea europaea subsp. europaea]